MCWEFSLASPEIATVVSGAPAGSSWRISISARRASTLANWRRLRKHSAGRSGTSVPWRKQSDGREAGVDGKIDRPIVVEQFAPAEWSSPPLRPPPAGRACDRRCLPDPVSCARRGTKNTIAHIKGDDASPNPVSHQADDERCLLSVSFLEGYVREFWLRPVPPSLPRHSRTKRDFW